MTDPTELVFSIEHVSGDAQQGLVGVPLEEKLAVRVSDIAGHPIANALVNWSVLTGEGSVTPSQSRSDNDGLARTSWTLGPDVGEQTAAADLPGLQSSTFTAIATTISQTCQGAPLDLPIGGSITLAGSGAVDVCLGSGTFFTHDYLVVAFNSTRSALSELEFTVQASGIVSPMGPPSPAPSPAQGSVIQSDRVPSTIRRNREFEGKLRLLESTELAPLKRGGAGNTLESRNSALVPSFAFSLSNPALGETVVLNANAGNSCSVPINRNGRVVAISQHAVVVEDIENPAGGFSTAEYFSLARTFDTLIYPVHAENFGEPADIDRNGKTILFYSVEVNRLTAAGAPGGTVSGFFFARDLYPRNGNSRLGSCAWSNEGELLYLMVPDPNGTINGNQRSKELVEQLTIATLAHEFEHLVNASRRMHVNIGAEFPEEVWLDEALAHNAEELVFYKASGLGPSQNISAGIIEKSSANLEAYEHFQLENVERLRFFLGATNSNWAFNSNLPNLGARGASASFLRYAVDRLGGTEAAKWRALVAGPEIGMRNLEQVVEADPVNWMRDWSVALYADDAVHYTSPRYQIPSWILRSITTKVGDDRPFALVPVTLLGNIPVSGTLEPGGALYFRFGVPPGGQGRLRVSPAGSDAGSFSIVLLRTL